MSRIIMPDGYAERFHQGLKAALSQSSNRLASILESGVLAAMYHGGTHWSSRPEVRGPRQGKYEAGPGIYLTTSYNRARQYAGGSRTVMRVMVDLSRVVLAQDVPVDANEVISFVKTIRMRNKAKMIEDLRWSAAKSNRSFTASHFINLLVNNEAGAGQVGVEVAQWLVDHGVTASLEKHTNNEEWLVVIDPSIIRSWSKQVVPAGFDEWDLPPISDRLT